MDEKQSSTKISRRKLLGVASTAALTGVLLGSRTGLSREETSVLDSVYGRNLTSDARGNGNGNGNGNANGIRRIVEEVTTQYAWNITSQNDLWDAINANKRIRCNIGEVIDMHTSMTLPERLTLSFTNEGMLRIKAGVAVTMNAQIDAGYIQIFDFESETSVLTTDQVKYGSLAVSTKVGYEIYPDWFGAVPDAYPAIQYNYNNNGPSGTDSTQAFRRCMSFAEAASAKYSLDPNGMQPSVTVALRPNSSYLVIGDNPMGVQSTVPDQCFFISIAGNGATVLWKPLSVADALFKKYGRIRRPRIENLNVLLIGQQGQRWGSFVSSRTGEGDQYHIWTDGVFRNLSLTATYHAVGYHTVFDIGTDGSHSHDDLTLVENVKAGCYQTFFNFANREAVNWKISKCSFSSFTEQAVHIRVVDGFSGGLTIDSCEILLRYPGEVFLQTGENASSTPIRILNGRMETRGSESFTFLHVKSGNVICNNVRFIAGNSAALPHAEARSAVLGEKAYIRFEDCTLYDQIDCYVSAIASQRATALSFLQCSFMANIRGNLRTLGYPTLHYLHGNESISLGQVMKRQLLQRRVIVEDPYMSDGGLLLPIEYSARSSNHGGYTYELYRTKPDGHPSLMLNGLYSLPPNIVITSIRLWMNHIDPSKVDSIDIQFHDDLNPSGNNTTLTYAWSDQADRIGTELLANQIVSIPGRSYLYITHRKNGAAVNDIAQLPHAWIELSYRAISKRQDVLAVDTKIGLKNLF